MKRTFYFCCLIFTMFLLTAPAFAQIGPPPPDPEQPVPLTGIEILVGAGAVFGAKKIIESRRQNKK